MKSGLRSLAASAAVAALVAGAGQAAAQSYPIDNVTLVTHSAAGGGTDVLLRAMNKYLAKQMRTKNGRDKRREHVCQDGKVSAAARALTTKKPTTNTILISHM